MPPGMEWMYALQGADTAAPPEQEEFVVVLTPTGYEVRSAELARYNGEAPIQTGFGSRDQAEAAAAELMAQRGGQSGQAPRYQVQQNIEAGRGDISGYENIPPGLPGGGAPPVDWTRTLQNYRVSQRPNQQRNQAELLAELQTPTAEGNRRVFDYGSPGLPGATLDIQTGSMKPTRADLDPSMDPTLSSPVDPYVQDLLSGTWAEGRIDNPMLTNIISGQMTPEAAVMTYLDAAGQEGYGNRNFLADLYQDFPAIQQLQNPGQPLDPVGQYVGAGDYVMGMLDRDADLQFIDAPALWDNQYSDAYVQQVRGLTEGQDNPGELERDMIIGNIAALSPYMGEQQTAVLAANVDREYNRYIAGGFNVDMSFVEYLRSIGAEDWL